MFICSECNRECEVEHVDFGIGAYEYWGATGYDSHEVEVSVCCEADFTDFDAPEDPTLDHIPASQVIG